MNFLNIGGCLPRYTKWPFRPNPCCRDILKQVSFIDADNIQNTPAQRKPKIVEARKSKSCCRSFPRLYQLTSYTQVRFRGGYPKLHRDVPFPNFENYRKNEFKDVRKTTWGSGDKKPGMTYVLGFFGVLGGVYGLKAELIHYVTFMGPPADVLALAQIEVDISNIIPGGCQAYKWRGKPLFIKNRTQAEIDLEARTPMSALKDPETEEQRTKRPQWLVVIGVCTHLGCVPIANTGDYAGGFYCPCHGTHYDNIGRVRRGPAPTNLEIPEHKFLSDTLLLVG